MRTTSFVLLCAVLAVAGARPALAGQEAPAAASIETAAPAATPSGTPAGRRSDARRMLAAAREQKGARAPNR